jgi:hypothetical protein
MIEGLAVLFAAILIALTINDEVFGTHFMEKIFKE